MDDRGNSRTYAIFFCHILSVGDRGVVMQAAQTEATRKKKTLSLFAPFCAHLKVSLSPVSQHSK